MQTRNKFDRAAYNRQYYADMKEEPAAYEAYLAVQREKKRRRTIKKQDKRIEEAAKRMASVNNPMCCPDYVHMATAALYPERLNQNAQ